MRNQIDVDGTIAAIDASLKARPVYKQQAGKY